MLTYDLIKKIRQNLTAIEIEASCCSPDIPDVKLITTAYVEGLAAFHDLHTHLVNMYESTENDNKRD